MIIEHFLKYLIPYIYGVLEFVGVAVIAIGGIRAVTALLASRFSFEDEDVKLQLAQSLALALEFKLGAEILKTVTTKDLEELAVLSIVVVLRVIMTFVIHWKIKSTHEEKKKKAQDLELAIREEKHRQATKKTHSESE